MSSSLTSRSGIRSVTINSGGRIRNVTSTNTNDGASPKRGRPKSEAWSPASPKRGAPTESEAAAKLQASFRGFSSRREALIGRKQSAREPRAAAHSAREPRAAGRSSSPVREHEARVRRSVLGGGLRQTEAPSSRRGVRSSTEAGVQRVPSAGPQRLPSAEADVSTEPRGSPSPDPEDETSTMIEQPSQPEDGVDREPSKARRRERRYTYGERKETKVLAGLSLPNDDLEEAETEAEAATKMQSSYRGFVARKANAIRKQGLAWVADGATRLFSKDSQPPTQQAEPVVEGSGAVGSDWTKE